MLAVSVVLALSLAAPFEAPTKVDEVRVSGLWFSREATVLRELPFAVGEDVDPAMWDLFVTRLWNLGVFSRVDVTLVEEAGRNVAMVVIEDRFPIGPVVRLNFGGGQFFLWAGVAHVNLFGRALAGRVFYERFGNQNGFGLRLNDPRFFDTRINALLEVEWLSRPLPEFVNRRAAVRLSFDFNPPGGIDDFVRIGIKVEGTSDEIFDPVVPPIPAHSKAISVGPFVRAGRLDTDRLRFVKGFIELRADSMATTDPKWPFAEILTLEGQYYWKLGTRFNIATRVMGGLELGARPQDRFYIGGLDRVRGYVYSEIRAQKFAIANSELRFIAFDSMWFAVMPLVFIDGGVAHADSGRLQALASVGGGVRLMSPRLVKFGVRFEVAFPLVASLQTPVGKPGINFGIWHYF